MTTKELLSFLILNNMDNNGLYCSYILYHIISIVLHNTLAIICFYCMMI